MRKSVIVGSITILVIVAASLALSAASPARLLQGSPTHTVTNPQVPDLIFNRKLVSTTQSYNNNLIAAGSGFTAMDSVLNFSCPAATCSVSAEQNAQVTGTVSGNRWAICTQVDGVYMGQPNCPYLGYVTSDGSYAAGSFTQNMSGVTHGAHTLQSFVYMDDAASLSIYNITYRLYTP
jgi:hypothetical protein